MPHAVNRLPAARDMTLCGTQRNHDVKHRPVSTTLYPQLAIIMTSARIDPCQTPTILEPCLRRTAKSVPVVFDDEVQPTSDKPELDSSARCCGVPMNVGQTLLHNPQQRKLQFEGERVRFCV